MSSPFPERGEFVPVRPPGPHDLPVGGAPAHQPWYGAMPPVDAEVVALPAPLRAAGWLWFLAAVLYVVGWVLAAFFDVPFFAADLASGSTDTGSGPGSGPGLGEARATAIVMFVIGIGVALLVGTGQSVLGFLLWRRQRWARVLLAVLGGLMLLVLPIDVLVGLAWRYDAPSDIGDPWIGFAIVAGLAAVQFGVTIAAMVTMFVRGSNLYLAGRHA